MAAAALATLDVYLSAHCFGCDEARRLAAAAERRFPMLRVRVVDLDHESAARPEELVAVPTYMLDGQVIALGNPRQRDLFRDLERSLGVARREEGKHGCP